MSSMNFTNHQGSYFNHFSSQSYSSLSQLNKSKIESNKVGKDTFLQSRAITEETKRQNYLNAIEGVQSIAYDNDVIKVQENLSPSFNQSSESKRDFVTEAKAVEITKALELAFNSIEELEEPSFELEDWGTIKEEGEKIHFKGQENEIEGSLEAYLQVKRIVETDEEKKIVTLEEVEVNGEEVNANTEEAKVNVEEITVIEETKVAEHQEAKNVGKQAIVEKTIEDIHTNELVEVTEDITQTPQIKISSSVRLQAEESKEIIKNMGTLDASKLVNISKKNLSKASVPATEKHDRKADLKAVQELKGLLPDLHSHLADKFVKVGDQYVGAKEAAEKFLSQNKLSHKEHRSFIDKFLRENTFHKFVDGKAVELSPEELEVFKQKFTQYATYILAVNNLAIFAQEQDNKIEQDQENLPITHSKQNAEISSKTANVATKREIDPQKVKAFIIQESTRDFVRRMRSITEKAIQEYRNRLYDQHQQEIRDYAKQLILEKEIIKKEQTRFDLLRLQQKMQEQHEEILNKSVEVLANLAEPLPSSTKEELKVVEKQAEEILPGIKLRKWGAEHQVEIATRLIPPLLPRRVRTSAWV
ncbi:hypothetical protein [Neochlamydia sp. AcF95]|uniref:hypothetical protein n=1 Tax=Neochlamydia sp. AcF95 TaxID=2795734 RepID=UPI001BC8F264|nr:hypothetical protein [Neochlamydia sp. AcF95]MBS4170009.1 Uncharacterized protein [Neochlamydia sp. AcF95]